MTLSSDASFVGGKARSLILLFQNGFPVPPFFVLLPGEHPDGLELKRQLKEIGGEAFAVRSSGIDEDGAGHSFAGQFETRLNVLPPELMTAIEEVRASGKSERLSAYRSSKGIAHTPIEPAVIIQRMVDAEIAGVAFSADPVTGRRGVVIVSAAPGLGEALVSGATDADGWEVDRRGGILNVHKTPGGARLCLEEIQVSEVALLARRCEAYFGAPQDIEWAIDGGGRMHLLQSRPITTLAGLPDPNDQLRVWDNSNIAESYSGITAPLTFSFARRAYEEVYRQFCRLMGVEAKRVQQHDDVFAQMLGSIRGRVYYNLLSWYRVLALLPGFSINRKFMEQMMGVREPLPEALTERVVDAARVSPLRDTIGLVRTLVGLIWNALLLPRNVRRFYKRLDTALASGEIPLEAQSPDELVRHYRHLEQQLLKRWDAPLVNDFFAMIAYGVLRSLCQKWLNDTDGTLQNSLLLDIDGIVSAEPPRLIREMAQLTPPSLAEMLAGSETPVSHKMNALRREPRLNEAFQRYLSKFGDRCLHELKLESPTLEENPGVLLTSIGIMASREMAHVPSKDAPNVDRPPGWRGWIFRWVLQLTRARVRDRENLRFERTRVFGRVRRIFRQLGGRLMADGVLPDEDAIFYLEVEEILRLVEGASAFGKLGEVAMLRRAQYDEWSLEPAPPDRIMTHGSLHRYLSFQEERGDKAAFGGDFIQGVGASPGVVQGRVRVVRDPRDATLEAGEILVAGQTDPGWVVLFAAASGLLVERGSVLSHSAIVSREMNLPCVVALPGLLDWLNTGDVVEFDGKKGTVRLVGRKVQ